MRKGIWLGGFLLVALTGLINIGIIAMDDYFDVVSKIIPAQNITFAEILNTRGIHSPLPAIVLAFFSKTAMHLGWLQPISQLRFVLLILGLVSFCVHSLLGLKVFRNSEKESSIFLFLVGFHFLAPLFFTRAMVETVSAIFVSLSLLFVWNYFQNNKKFDLFLSALFALIAFQFRYQTLSIVPGVFLAMFFERRFKGSLFYMGLLGAGLFVSGFFEKTLTGEFFGIARPYFEYNLHHSSGHGTTPFYTFLLVFMGIAIFPFFISKYEKFQWNRYRELFPILFPFGSFVVLHSIIPHKEERFMVPVLTLFFILLTPLATYLAQFRWRKVGFIGVNLALLLGSSFSVPQRNSILMVDYLAREIQFNRVIGVNDTLVLYPQAYGMRRLPKLEIKELDLNKIELMCSDAVAIRQDYLQENPSMSLNLEQVAEFKPGFLEAALVKLNPTQNARRGGIVVFRRRGCAG